LQSKLTMLGDQAIPLGLAFRGEERVNRAAATEADRRAGIRFDRGDEFRIERIARPGQRDERNRFRHIG
jgi:hypothetical protein